MFSVLFCVMSRKHWIHGHVTSKWLILSRIIKLMHHQRVASSTWILISASDFHTKNGNCVNFKLPQYRLLTRLSRCALYLFTKEGIRKAKHLSPPWFFLLFLTLISPDSRRRRTKKADKVIQGGKKFNIWYGFARLSCSYYNILFVWLNDVNYAVWLTVSVSPFRPRCCRDGFLHDVPVENC